MSDLSIPRTEVEVYTGSKQKILELLGNGVAPLQVADAVGVDPSYVSQLLGEEEFAKQVMQLRFNRLQKAANRDQKWDNLEDKLLDKLEDVVEYMVRPMEILAALRILNSATRRGGGLQPTTNIDVNIVHLHLPIKLLQRFKVNNQNQVIEVDGESMATMASNVLQGIVEKDVTPEGLLYNDPQANSIPAGEPKEGYGQAILRAASSK